MALQLTAALPAALKAAGLPSMEVSKARQYREDAALTHLSLACSYTEDDDEDLRDLDAGIEHYRSALVNMGADAESRLVEDRIMAQMNLGKALCRWAADSSNAGSDGGGSMAAAGTKTRQRPEVAHEEGRLLIHKAAKAMKEVLGADGQEIAQVSAL
jgi:hypothetical protein